MRCFLDAWSEIEDGNLVRLVIELLDAGDRPQERRNPAKQVSPQIRPEDLKGRTADELRQFAEDKCLVPHATKPDKFMDPVTEKEGCCYTPGTLTKKVPPIKIPRLPCRTRTVLSPTGQKFEIQKTATRTFQPNEQSVNQKEEFVSLSDGEIAMWIEQGTTVHLRVVSKFGDPVEMGAEGAKQLARELLRLASIIE